MPRFALAAMLLVAAGQALSAPTVWHDVRAHSRLDWTAHWRGTPVKGTFRHFEVSAEFDPASPAGGSLTVQVDTASAATASPDIARAIRGQAWFDAAQYPQAVFSSDSITAQDDGSMLVKGSLTLKGRKKSLSFPMKLERQGEQLTLTGTLTLDRRDFAIGAGQWSKTSPIAAEVTVGFQVTLRSGK